MYSNESDDVYSHMRKEHGHDLYISPPDYGRVKGEKVSDQQIKDLNQQLKELNIHINTLNRVEKSDPDGIKNASLGLIIDFSKSGNNTGNKKKKHHK